MDLGLRAGGRLLNEPGGRLTVRVAAVARGLLQVGADQGLQNAGVAAFGIVVLEAVHLKVPLIA